jgi:hypothetical protein
MKYLFLMAFALGVAPLTPAADTGADIARLLSRESTREIGISRVIESRARVLPLLLSWTTNPPKNIDISELNIGLAEVFAKLRTQEAVPFLIANISMKRGGNVDFAPWLKTPEAIEGTYPAVEALIQIGPVAATQVIVAARGRMTSSDRLAAIFVVSRIKSVPGAKQFLRQAKLDAETQANWATLGLSELEHN